MCARLHSRIRSRRRSSTCIGSGSRRRTRHLQSRQWKRLFGAGSNRCRTQSNGSSDSDDDLAAATRRSRDARRLGGSSTRGARLEADADRPHRHRRGRMGVRAGPTVIERFVMDIGRRRTAPSLLDTGEPAPAAPRTRSGSASPHSSDIAFASAAVPIRPDSVDVSEPHPGRTHRPNGQSHCVDSDVCTPTI